jgi:hypothetical protein
LRKQAVVRSGLKGEWGDKSQRRFSDRRTCRILVGLFLFAIVSSTTGCMGVAIRHIEKGSETSYAELKNSVPPVPPGFGRLFVYLAGGGPNVVNTMGLMGHCVVDEDVYGIMGKTYWYIELPPGDHKITDSSAGIKARIYYGKNSVYFNLKDSGIVYCRMEFKGWGAYTPVIVEPSTAEQQLPGLDFYKNFNKNKKVTKRPSE